MKEYCPDVDVTKAKKQHFPDTDLEQRYPDIGVKLRVPDIGLVSNSYMWKLNRSGVLRMQKLRIPLVGAKGYQRFPLF